MKELYCTLFKQLKIQILQYPSAFGGFSFVSDLFRQKLRGDLHTVTCGVRIETMQTSGCSYSDNKSDGLIDWKKGKNLVTHFLFINFQLHFEVNIYN